MTHSSRRRFVQAGGSLVAAAAAPTAALWPKIGMAAEEVKLGLLHSLSGTIAIAEAANNHYYISTMLALKDQIGVVMKFHGATLLGPQYQLEGVLAEHLAIFEAIRNRDAERAASLMRAHLEGSRDRVFEGRLLDLSL